MYNTNEYLRKFNSTDYSFNKGENVERFLTKRTLETKHTYTSKEIYLRKTTNKFGTFYPGDNKIKEAFDTEERFNSILQCWQSITNYEHKDVLQVSSGLNHYVRNICIVDVDADNWNEWFINDVKKLNPTYIIKTQSNHLQIGWAYKSSVFPKQNTKAFLLGNMSIRYIAAKNNLLKDNQVYGDDNYTGWQCKNPYSKRNVQLYYNENNMYECNDLQSRFSKFNDLMSTKYVNVNVDKAKQRLDKNSNSNINALSSSLSIIVNKVISNKHNNNCTESRTVILYNKLRTAITQIKNNKAKRNEEPTCSYEEALRAAEIIAKDNQLNKGILPHNEIEATTRCTLKWVNANWKPFEKDSTRCSANMDKIRKFEKQIKDLNFIILHGKIVEERERREKLGLSTSTRAIGEALVISPATVSLHNRKTEAELYEYVMSASQLAARLVDCSNDSELFRKYSKDVEEFNKVITIYNSSLFPSLSIIVNKVISNKTEVKSNTESTTTTETTTEQVEQANKQAEETFNLTKHCATEENRYKTWEEFCQSNIVCNQLRRRPRPKDWLDYTKGKLIIGDDAYAI